MKGKPSHVNSGIKQHPLQVTVFIAFGSHLEEGPSALAQAEQS